MFEQSLVEAGVRTRRPWTVGVSVLMQSALVGVGLLIPLVNPDLLPRTAAMIQVILPPSAPDPPPPDLMEAAPAPRTTRLTQTLDGRILEPGAIPKEVAIIDEPRITSSERTGVRGLEDAFRRAGNAIADSIGELVPSRPPPPEVKPAPAEEAKTIVRITQGGMVQEALLINRVIPPYPPLARATGTQGRVSFSALIGRDGSIMNLQVLSGHPLLRQAAFDAVRQWRYKPTMLNGVPVEVATTIDVNFTISR